VDEEVVLLEEQLAAAQNDIERLQSQLAEAEAREGTRLEELAELRRHAAVYEESIAAQTIELEDLRATVSEAQSATREAVQRVRQSILDREPDLPHELVTGETVADLDSALTAARQTVAQVRQHLEQQAQSLRVPAGAPVRTVGDTAPLTPGEKIRAGLKHD
jgi:chromosome segregation ATPase